MARIILTEKAPFLINKKMFYQLSITIEKLRTATKEIQRI